MIAVDTNLLVYAHRADVPEHAAAVRVMEPLLTGSTEWGFSVAVGGEFWGVVTHAPLWKRASRPEETARFLTYLIEESGARVFPPSEGFLQRVVKQAARLRVAGARIHDLQIGLMSLESGATELWTHDRQFMAPPGLSVVDPFPTA